MLSSSLQADIRAVDEHLFGTGTYIMFQRIKTELALALKPPHNSAMDAISPGKCQTCCNTTCKLNPVGGCNYDPRYVPVQQHHGANVVQNKPGKNEL